MSTSRSQAILLLLLVTAMVKEPMHLRVAALPRHRHRTDVWLPLSLSLWLLRDLFYNSKMGGPFPSLCGRMSPLDCFVLVVKNEGLFLGAHSSTITLKVLVVPY